MKDQEDRYWLLPVSPVPLDRAVGSAVGVTEKALGEAEFGQGLSIPASKAFCPP